VHYLFVEDCAPLYSATTYAIFISSENAPEMRDSAWRPKVQETIALHLHGCDCALNGKHSELRLPEAQTRIYLLERRNVMP
jgi:hypothetical protein